MLRCTSVADETYYEAGASRLRAGDLLSGTTDLRLVPSRLDVDPDEGRVEAEQWLANWLGVDSDVAAQTARRHHVE